MTRQETVDIYSAIEDRGFKIDADELRSIAKAELGMVDGPFELTIFTQTVLATALQREQIVRNADLKKAMTEGGDWKNAMQMVAAVTGFMEKLGIADANWSPTGESTAPGIPQKPAAPLTPDTGQQRSLNLDGQTELELS